VRNLTFEQQLLHEAALKEHKQALQQLRQELASLDSITPAAAPPPPPPAVAAAAAAAPAAAAAAAELTVFGDLICGQGSAAGVEAAAATDIAVASTSRLVSGFASASGAAAAAAAAAADVAEGLDAGSILLDFPAAGGGSSNAAGGESSRALLDLQTSAVSEQQLQQQRQRGKWGPPALDIGPAAGAENAVGKVCGVAGSESMIVHWDQHCSYIQGRDESRRCVCHNTTAMATGVKPVGRTAG
jgi:hypothetical protein